MTLHRIIWQNLVKPLSLCPRETHAYVYKATHMKMLIATLFVITKPVNLPDIHSIG